MQGGVMAKRRNAQKLNWADIAAILCGTAAAGLEAFHQLFVVHSLAIDVQKQEKQEQRDFAVAAAYEIEQIAGGPEQ